MFSRSIRTIRVRGIDGSLTIEQFESLAERICSAYPGAQVEGLFALCSCFWRPRSRLGGDLVVSLARQGQQQTGTITFPHERLKNSIPRAYYRDWDIDDTFVGLTVLHSTLTPELDICAVHGFNGNAFDTWAVDSHTMWLRDFIPSHPQLGNSRVMTYGYSSLLRDTGDNSGLEEWAHGLLSELSSVRVASGERTRPLILICHSLGGLIGREAMIQLSRDSHLYPGLQLKYCGLLFLGTPHSGAKPADWNPYLVQLAELIGIRAKDFTQLLHSFNNRSRVSKREFGLLKPTPPFECLYETRKTKVGFRRRIIVTADAAGLNGVSAQAMSNVDHRDICRFPSKTHPGYIQIGACLSRILERIPQESAHRSTSTGISRHVKSKSGDSEALTLIGMTDDSPPYASPPESPADIRPAHTYSSHSDYQIRKRESGGIRAGMGWGGDIMKDAERLVLTGGYATGAFGNLNDLEGFRGKIEGGTGLGAEVATG